MRFPSCIWMVTAIRGSMKQVSLNNPTFYEFKLRAGREIHHCTWLLIQPIKMDHHHTSRMSFNMIGCLGEDRKYVYIVIMDHQNLFFFQFSFIIFLSIYYYCSASNLASFFVFFFVTSFFCEVLPMPVRLPPVFTTLCPKVTCVSQESRFVSLLHFHYLTIPVYQNLVSSVLPVLTEIVTEIHLWTEI